MNLYTSFTALEEAKRSHYGQFTFDTPLLLSREQNDNMAFIQQCLLECINHFASNVEKYRQVMPLSDRVMDILAICERFPYRPGTYRTDFVVTEEGRVKIIEITARFALNGFVRSGIVNGFAERWASERGIETQSQYPGFFGELENYVDGEKEILLLKNDSFNEGKYLITLFGAAGYQVDVLDLGDLPRNADRIASSMCVAQLSHDELLALPDDVIEAMMEGNLLNDLRTVLLVHDKRFFALLWDDAFRDNALGPEKSRAFKEYVTPTFTPLAHPDLWGQLPQSAEEWIVKPTALGMGLGITARPAVSETEWLGALASSDPQATVFQPYLTQRRFSGMVGSEVRTNDYVTGTLLFFQGGYFGPGMFRASSHPVTNVGDDRKIATATLSSAAPEIDPQSYKEMMLL
jgi:hypothetical protein